MEEKCKAIQELSRVRNVLNDFSLIYRGFVKAKKNVLSTGYRKGMGNLCELERGFEGVAKTYGVLLKETIRVLKELGGPLIDFRTGPRAAARTWPNSPYSLVMEVEKNLKRFDQRKLLDAYRKNGEGGLHDFLVENCPDDFAGLSAYLEEADKGVEGLVAEMENLKGILEV